MPNPAKEIKGGFGKMKPIHLDYLIKFALQENDLNRTLIARRKLMVLLRDNFKCIKCGARDLLTVDHRHNGMRNSKGHRTLESYTLEECDTLCVYCHIEKNGTEMQRDKSTLTVYEEK